MIRYIEEIEQASEFFDEMVSEGFDHDESHHGFRTLLKVHTSIEESIDNIKLYDSEIDGALEFMDELVELKAKYESVIFP